MEWKLKEKNKDLNIKSDQPLDKKTTELLSTMDISNEFVNDIITLLNNPRYEYDIYKKVIQFKDMDQASDLLLKYIKEHKHIMVITDYDSDGINSAAMAYKFFKDEVVKNIPDFNSFSIYVNKPKDGYGINKTIVNMIKEHYNNKNVDLIITMDHGIVNEEAYKEIKRDCPDLKIIITDHHEIQENLYPVSADFVIDNKRKDNPIQVEASGCLMGYYLLLVTYTKLYVGYEKGVNEGIIKGKVGSFLNKDEELLVELVPHLAISLLSDVIPVDNIYNRIILKLGLEILNKHKSKYPCWDTIKDLFKLPDEKILTEDDLAYKISPLLNLGKRAGESDLVFKMLTSENREEVLNVINTLNIYNINRKNITEKVYKFTKENLSNTYKYSKVALITCEYNIGGSIASKLSEDYKGVPTICFNGSMENEHLEGSGRLSIPDIDFMKILKEVEELGKEAGIDIFIKYGGHKEAVGVTINANTIDTFKNFLDIAASKYVNESNLIKCKYYNLEIQPYEIKDYGFIVSELSPYGKNFPKPIFKSKLEVKNVRKYNTYAILDFDVGDDIITGFYPKRTTVDAIRLLKFIRNPQNDIFGYKEDFIYTISCYSKYNKEKDEYVNKYSLTILDML